ncbi:MAG TPA: hypothetical protein VKB49_17610 [Candidatus Sulfotelmatobacter sp.]|nr:hypothetical protein [Candidatus Sulfotelmatobacter sp.]
MAALNANKPIIDPIHQHEFIFVYTIWATYIVGWHTLPHQFKGSIPTGSLIVLKLGGAYGPLGYFNN